ncbi:MAG: hypothetical protein KC505_08140 [Myxococcales bacterium]|nr:hypothetical protein [Myxococcales bacterium]USN50735.1 MAG: hypothetical protein H6731_10840 [Myxococcales bacterium]
MRFYVVCGALMALIVGCVDNSRNGSNHTGNGNKSTSRSSNSLFAPSPERLLAGAAKLAGDSHKFEFESVMSGMDTFCEDNRCNEDRILKLFNSKHEGIYFLDYLARFIKRERISDMSTTEFNPDNRTIKINWKSTDGDRLCTHLSSFLNNCLNYLSKQSVFDVFTRKIKANEQSFLSFILSDSTNEIYFRNIIRRLTDIIPNLDTQLQFNELSHYLFYLAENSKNEAHLKLIAKIEQRLRDASKLEDYIKWTVKNSWSDRPTGFEFFMMRPLYGNVSGERQKELRKLWLSAAIEQAKVALQKAQVNTKNINKVSSFSLLLSLFSMIKPSDIVRIENGKELNVIAYLVHSLKGAPLKDVRIQIAIHLLAKEMRGVKSKDEWQKISKSALDILLGTEGVNDMKKAKALLLYDQNGISDW